MVETKLSGRTPGTTLYIVSAADRNGNMKQTSDGRVYKLFLVLGLFFIACDSDNEQFFLE